MVEGFDGASLALVGLGLVAGAAALPLAWGADGLAAGFADLPRGSEKMRYLVKSEFIGESFEYTMQTAEMLALKTQNFN